MKLPVQKTDRTGPGQVPVPPVLLNPIVAMNERKTTKRLNWKVLYRIIE